MTNQYSMKHLSRTMLIALTFNCVVALAPAGAQVQFDHVVIIDQENRTPDNLFGSNPTFEPGVDIQTYGVNSKIRPCHLRQSDLRVAMTWATVTCHFKRHITMAP